MRRKWQPGVGILVLFLCVSAACDSRDAEPPIDRGPWRVTIGTSGGVTGGGGGLELWSDGSFFSHRFDDPYGARETTYLGEVDRADRERVVGLLGRATAIEQRQFENMTTSLCWQGLAHDFRYDWSWEMGDTTIAAVLRELEATLQPERLTITAGEPPSVLDAPGRADLFVATDGSFTLTLGNADGDVLRAGGRGANVLDELKGKTLTLADADGQVTIGDVRHGWISGTLVLDGRESSFRVPAWLEIAP